MMKNVGLDLCSEVFASKAVLLSFSGFALFLFIYVFIYFRIVDPFNMSTLWIILGKRVI